MAKVSLYSLKDNRIIFGGNLLGITSNLSEKCAAVECYQNPSTLGPEQLKKLKDLDYNQACSHLEHCDNWELCKHMLLNVLEIIILHHRVTMSKIVAIGYISPFIFKLKLVKIKQNLKISSSDTLVTFQVLKSLIWLVAIIVDNTDCWTFLKTQKVLLGKAALVN